MLFLASQIWGTKPHRSRSKLLVSMLPPSVYTFTHWWNRKLFPNKIHIIFLTDKAVVLKHHPDKRRAAGEQITEGDNDYFTCITKGFTLLSTLISGRSTNTLWLIQPLMFKSMFSSCICYYTSYRDFIWPCEEESLWQCRPHLWQRDAIQKWGQRQLF